MYFNIIYIKHKICTYNIINVKGTERPVGERLAYSSEYLQEKFELSDFNKK